MKKIDVLMVISDIVIVAIAILGLIGMIHLTKIHNNSVETYETRVETLENRVYNLCDHYKVSHEKCGFRLR